MNEAGGEPIYLGAGKVFLIMGRGLIFNKQEKKLRGIKGTEEQSRNRAKF